MVKVKPRFTLYSVVFLFLVALSACSNEKSDDSSRIKLQAPNVQKPSSPTLSVPEATMGAFEVSEIPTPGDLHLPTVGDLKNHVMFVRGETLYLGQLDGSEAVAIAEGINAQYIYASPNYDAIIYLTVEGQLMTQNLETLDQTELLTIDIGALYAFGWSPNGEWIALVWMSPTDPEIPLTSEQLRLLATGELFKVPMSTGVFPDVRLILAGLDGTTHLTKAYPIGGDWLEDNRFLAFTLPYGDHQYENNALVLIDPTTGDERRVDYVGSTLTVSNGMENLEFRPAAQTVLNELGLVLAPPSEDKFVGELAISPTKDSFITTVETEAARGSNVTGCKSISLVHKPISKTMVPEIVYQTDTPNVVGLVGLRWLPDDSIIFVLQISETCDSSNVSNVLLRLPLGGQPTVITEQLSTTGTPYAVSQSGRYIVWIGIDDKDNTSFVELTDLQKSISRKLLISVLDAQSENRLLDGKTFHAVYWVR